MQFFHVINANMIKLPGSRPFECPLCEMTFRTSGHKRAHLLVHYRGAFREGKDPKGNKFYKVYYLT